MDIFSNTLLYLLSRKISGISVLNNSDSITVSSLQIFCREQSITSHTLYLVPQNFINEFISCRTARPCTYLFIHIEPFQIEKVVRKQDSAFSYEGKLSALDLSAKLIEEWNSFDKWNTCFLQAIIKELPFREIVLLGRKYLPWDYGFSDFESDSLFTTPGFRKYIRKTLPDQPSSVSSSEIEESMLQLVIDRNSQNADQRTDSFYLFDSYFDMVTRNRNFFRNGRLIAIFVMYLNEGETKLPKGAEEIYDCFVEHMQLVFQNTTFPARDFTHKPLHNLIFHLLQNKPIPENELQNTLSAYHWYTDRPFSLIKLRFSGGNGHPNHTQPLLPLVIQELEKNWPCSAGLLENNEIIWVINNDFSNSNTNTHDFFQRLAVFLRDHACKASVSPMFRDLRHLPQASLAADIAFRLGETLNPSYWYYRFEDYRLNCVYEQMAKTLPVEMMYSSAINILDQYDHEKGTSLLETLRSYLDHGQNMSEASEALFIHRTTFFRRIDRISLLTGLDLKNANTVFSLWFSLKIFDLSTEV